MLRFLASFFLLLCFCDVAIAKEKVCLNMIVKNESHVIRRALDSAKPFIDCWAIVDTGSTDGTQEIIREHMKDIPGTLIERPWKNFAHNRNEALELARTIGDYILFLDADDWFALEEGFELPSLTNDAYTVWWHFSCGFSYAKPQLIKATLPWRWEGVWHEYLALDQPFSQAPLEGITYRIGGDGASHSDPDKYLKAAQVIEEALKEDPTNTRYMFYLAESWRDAGKPLEALACYQKRVAMGGWEEEVFWSLLQIAKLKEALHFPQDDVLDAYERAHRYRPHRIEPVYYAARLLNQNRRFELAYAYIKGYSYIPQPAQKDALFNEDWVTEFGLPFELSLAAYWVGHLDEFANLTLNLQTNPRLRDPWKDAVQYNLQYIPPS